MGSYDLLGERYGLDPDTLEALNTRYGPPPDAVDGDGLSNSGVTPQRKWLNEHVAEVQRRGVDVAPPKLGPGDMPNVPKDSTVGRFAEPTTEKRALTGAEAATAAATGAESATGPHRLLTREEAREARAAGINPTEDAPDVHGGGAGVASMGGGGGGGPSYIGWIPSSRQAQFGYSNEETAPLKEAVGKRQEATERKLETETALANQQGIVDAAYANSYAGAARLHEQQWQANEERKQRYVESELRRLNELATQTQKEVDPDAYWKERGSGARFLGILGVALGAFGAALTGGQNQAMQLINADIDRNIRAQETNQAQAGKALAAGENLFQRNLDAFGDRERAIQATRINYLDRVSAELNAVLADESRPLQERQRAQAMQEKVMADRSASTEQFMKLSHTQINQADRFGSIGGGGGAGGAAGKPLENTVQLADGTVVQLDGKEQANDVAKTLGYHAQMQQLDQRALALRHKLDGLDPFRNRVEYQSAYRELEMAGKDRSELASQAKGQGVITKEDAKREESVGLNYTQGFGGNVATGTFSKHIDPTAKGDRTIGDNTIRSSIDRSAQQERALVAAHRGRIIQGKYQRDATGNLKPVDTYTGQDPKPTEHRAPNGFKPMDPEAQVPTRGKSLAQETPKAPVVQAPMATGVASGGDIKFNLVGGSSGGGGKRGGGRKRK